ncbi:unnamed protein product [Phytomonas sp. EM1]|nr:unnamed protein product [Phytomonas sp. EM1]|eukprot:CCW63068.1 unnamed protein product [Phytomonas sp. isolate EM1]
MFFEKLAAFDDLDITSTAFRATVSEEEPFNFAAYASQDIHASVRITHLYYTPPSSLKDLREYYDKRPGTREANREVVAFLQQLEEGQTTPCSSSTPLAQPPPVLSVVAKVRSLTANNQVASFVIACFPFDLNRLTRIPSLPASAASSSEKPKSPSLAVLPGIPVVPSDVVGCLNIRLDVDGSVGFEVEGPGRVTFFGEQSSALIPEWMNHHMFSVGKDDEEMPEDDSDDGFDEMYRAVIF